MSTILSQLKPLKIGDLTAKLPIIQGGMGVGISLSSLAGAVAGAGGIGIISTAQIGFREPDFAEHPQEANLRAIGSELQKARAIAKGGIVGFNIMVATKNYAEYVKTAVKAGADLIISGAGLPVSLPEYVKGTATKIAPIVSSVKAATVICRMWDRKYQTAPTTARVPSTTWSSSLPTPPAPCTWATPAAALWATAWPPCWTGPVTM